MYDGLNGENATQGMEIPHATNKNSDVNETQTEKHAPLNKNKVEEKEELKSEMV